MVWTMPREEVWRRSARGDWRTAHSEGWKAVGEGEAAHAGRQQARRRVLRKSVCKGMEESLPRFFRFFKKAGLVCFSSVVSGKAEKADAFREIFPALGEECLPPCVFRFLRLIILPLSGGGESREVTKRGKLRLFSPNGYAGREMFRKSRQIPP